MKGEKKVREKKIVIYPYEYASITRMPPSQEAFVRVNSVANVNV
jgi:hypothetical protein